MIRTRHDLSILVALFGYLALATVISYFNFGLFPLEIRQVARFMYIFLPFTAFVSLIYLLVSAMNRRRPLTQSMSTWLNATVLTLCFLLFWPSFTSVKISIPEIVPFYFDPYLIRIDRWLHLGFDPWQIVHRSGLFRDSRVFELVYLYLWIVAAHMTPIVLLYFDRDARRRTHFILLYILTWVVLGNVLAVAFSAVGPIYVERLNGNPEFRSLMDSLHAAGYESSRLLDLQDMLWQNYASGTQQLGSGISAFPSVHVGVACVQCLYLSARQRWLIAPGWLYVAAILAGSVFCGWHYAVDGYVAIGIVLLMHRLLRKPVGKLIPAPARGMAAGVRDEPGRERWAQAEARADVPSVVAAAVSS